MISVLAVKLVQVDRYRTRLKERERRKRLAREYNLIETANLLAKQKCSTPKKKQIKDDKYVHIRDLPNG